MEERYLPTVVRMIANPYQVEHIKLLNSIRNKGVISNAEEWRNEGTMSAIIGRMATYSGK